MSQGRVARTEIDALLLKPEMPNDAGAVADALYAHLDRTLGQMAGIAAVHLTAYEVSEVDAEVRAARTMIRRSDQAPRALSQARQAAPADQSQPASEPAAHRSSWRIH